MSTGIEQTPQATETESSTCWEQDLFKFSSGDLPEKMPNICRIFYNNINGFEINNLVDSEVRNNKRQKKENINTTVEEYTKVESFFQQMVRWQVNISAIAEHCVE